METRGIRNNNPLNIRHSADQWQGARDKQTDKSFVQFKSMAYGMENPTELLQPLLCTKQSIYGKEHYRKMGTTQRERYRGLLS